MENLIRVLARVLVQMLISDTIFFDWERWNAFASVISFNDPVDGLLFGVSSGSIYPCYLKLDTSQLSLF